MRQCEVLVDKNSVQGPRRCSMTLDLIKIKKKWHCRIHKKMLLEGAKLKYTTRKNIYE